MPAKSVPRPSQKQQLATGTLVGDLDPSVVSRHLSELGDALEQTQNSATPTRFQGQVSLVVGSNVISHGLGRKPNGATVTPTVADATFAWAMTAVDNRQATIAVVGVPQPRAYVEIF